MTEQLGHYRILERIGSGSLGEVYRARDTRHGRTVAVKVLPDAIVGDERTRERFLAAARAAASLSHPNIATVYEIGDDAGRIFLVSEFVPGDPLEVAIGGRPMNPRIALRLAGQMADALADAHARGVAHRDLRHGNVMVTPKGNAKLLDWGFSAWTGACAAGASARVAPDLGDEAAGERSDIASLGAILYEMLTGRAPFPAPNPSAAASGVAPAAPPSTFNTELPRELDDIVAKTLSPEGYASAATLAAEIRRADAILDQRAQAAERMAPAAAAPGAARRRSALPWIAAALAAAGLAAAWRLFIP